MQVHQRMDLDQINENEADHKPIKPSIKNNQNQNQNAKNIKNQNNKKRRNKRKFGEDLTNQQRQNQNNNKIKRRNSNNNGFNFVKPPINEHETKPILKIITKNQEKHDDEQEKEEEEEGGENKFARKLNMDQDSENERDSLNTSFTEIIDLQELAPWDYNDTNNDLFVTDYVNDIMSNLRDDEIINRGGCIIENNIDFMSQQKDVNARMRTVLVDWLVEVHRKFKLLPNTYFLGINLLDRYLTKKQLHRRKLQLCGCTCLWIASKYHEIYAPEMDDFVYISDNAFNDQELMRMEIDILKTLSFTLTVPTVLNYAQRYTKISSYYLKKEKEIKIISDLIMYCIEHCIMSYDLCRLLPSLIGAASFVYSCLSTKVFSIQTFENDNIDKVIGYSFNELIPIMTKIDLIVRNAKRSKHKAVYKKYCNQKFSNIGKLNFDKLNTSFLHKSS